MATTIASNDLTTRVTETITLNGTNYDTTTTYTIAGVTNYVSNVFSVKTGTQRILSFSRTATPPVDKEYDVDDTVYLRITNADDTVDVTVICTYLSSGPQNTVLPPGGSLIMTDFAFATADTLESIQIVTTADVDLPYAIGLKQ